MKTTRGVTLTAMALLMGACQDAPTLPDLGEGNIEAAAAAALDQGSAQAQASVDAQLVRMPRDTSATTRPDLARPRPDGTRPRPETVRPRPDTARPHRDTIRRPDRPRPDRSSRAELAVALGAEAVDLAARLLHEHGADEHQKRFFEQAQELQRKAEAALDEGRDAAAVELAQAASQFALKAVVLPGGITDEEARMIHDVAQDLLRKAQEAVKADPSEAKRHLLNVAEELYRNGTEQLGERRGDRGVAALWKSATISSYLIG